MSSPTYLRAVSPAPIPAVGKAPNEPEATELSQSQPVPAAAKESAAQPAPAAVEPKANNVLTRTKDVAINHILPPAVVLFLLVSLWQILCSQPGSSLPSFTQVITDTSELILHPFYDNGGNDVGLGWQLLASLKRVAYG